MYNANKPDPEELPSSAQLLKSTILAAIAAVVILVTIVLPSEYGIDPTRIGKLIGLAEMGQIKSQLAKEAEADRKVPGTPKLGKQSSIADSLLSLLVTPAHAQMTKDRTDEVKIKLTPGESAEIKLVMEKGGVVEFAWIVEGGVVNYDLHGDGTGDEFISYKKARAVPGHKGKVIAEFKGNHGWFWRNRGKQDVTVTLTVRGAYSEIKRTS